MKTATELKIELHELTEKIKQLEAPMRDAEKAFENLKVKIERDNKNGLINSDSYKKLIEIMINQACIAKLLDAYLFKVNAILHQAKERYDFLDAQSTHFFNQGKEKAESSSIQASCLEIALLSKVDRDCQSLFDNFSSFGDEIDRTMYYLMKDFMEDEIIETTIEEATHDNDLMIEFCTPWLLNVKEQKPNPYYTALKLLPSVNELEYQLITRSASSRNDPRSLLPT